MSAKRSAQHIGKRQAVDDLEKAKPTDWATNATPKISGISVSVLPINECSDEETDRGHIPIQEVIKELIPQPVLGSNRPQTPDKPQHSSNYFSRTGGMFFPDGARDASKFVEE